MWCVLQKWGNFAHFQSSISPLSLMMELRFSLLTCRNSYIVYPKNVFNDLELERSNGTRVLPYFHQKWQQRCIQRLSKIPRNRVSFWIYYHFQIFFKFFILEGMGSNFTKVSYINVTPVHSI